MEEKKCSCPPADSGGQHCCTQKKCCSHAPFIVGLVVALVFGWCFFPDLLFSQKEQPVKFTHKTHVEGQGLECSSCHFFRDDGSFAGRPSRDSCESCHSSAQGESKAELDYIKNFVEPGKEVPWLIHQKQPDNVFFSHAAHDLKNCVRCHRQWKEQDICKRCHPTLEELDKGIPYKENILTGYSAKTMKMQQCEACHSRPAHWRDNEKIKKRARANNACFTCHK